MNETLSVLLSYSLCEATYCSGDHILYTCIKASQVSLTFWQIICFLDKSWKVTKSWKVEEKVASLGYKEILLPAPL